MACNDLIINANNPYIKKDGTVIFSANQSLGGNKFTNVGDAVNKDDLVNYGQLLTALGNITSIGGEYICGENIPPFTVVYIKTDGKIYKANTNDITQMNKIIGITTASALNCDVIKVIQVGVLKGLSGIIPGKYYFFNSTGVLDYHAPTTGFTQVVAVGILPTMIQVTIQIPMGL
jgi:hypothetical protein